MQCRYLHMINGALVDSNKINDACFGEVLVWLPLSIYLHIQEYGARNSICCGDSPQWSWISFDFVILVCHISCALTRALILPITKSTLPLKSK